MSPEAKLDETLERLERLTEAVDLILELLMSEEAAPLELMQPQGSA